MLVTMQKKNMTCMHPMISLSLQTLVLAVPAHQVFTQTMLYLHGLSHVHNVLSTAA